MNYCEKCEREFNEALFKSVKKVDAHVVELINEYTENDYSVICVSCCNSDYEIAQNRQHEEISRTSKAIAEKINCIQIITSHMPQGWEYETIGILT